MASIKRIISDDQAPQKPAAPRVASGPTPTEPSFAERRAAPRVQPVTPPRIDDENDDAPPPWPSRTNPPAPSVLELTDRLPEAYRPEPIRRESPAPPPEPEPRPVQRAVERLRQAEAEAEMPAAPRPVPRDLLPRTPAPRSTDGDITLDALVREMLQPMLADWIERNLPDIVERLVQSEIRRMTDKD